jgi:hypothetical protein
VAGGNSLHLAIFEFLRRASGVVDAILPNVSTIIETAYGNRRSRAKFPLVFAGAQCIQCLDMRHACTIRRLTLPIMIKTPMPPLRFFG